MVDENFILRDDTYNIVLGGGDPPIYEKPVYQYDLNGNLIKVWNSVRDCRKEFGNVSRVLSGKAKQCKGYTFKYYNS